MPALAAMAQMAERQVEASKARDDLVRREQLVKSNDVFLIQNACISAGSGSISSRRTAPLLAKCFAATIVSVADNSSQISAWFKAGTRSTQSCLAPELEHDTSLLRRPEHDQPNHVPIVCNRLPELIG
jgi:hypothetical protein